MKKKSYHSNLAGMIPIDLCLRPVKLMTFCVTFCLAQLSDKKVPSASSAMLSIGLKC